MRNRKFHLKQVAKDFVDGFIQHDVMTLSAALAFYTALSLAPLLLITLAIIGSLGLDLRPDVTREIRSLMGPEAAKAITAIVENVKEEPRLSTLAGVLGTLTLIFSASGVFAQLHTSLNLIWQSAITRDTNVWTWLKHRLLSVGMVFTMAFLGTVSLLASAALSFAFSTVHETLWETINTVVSLGLFTLVFGAIFKLVPDSNLTWKRAFSGGLFTSVMFTIGKYFIGLYLGQSAMASAYGAAGSLIMLLIWVYYSAVIFFMGAEFTRALTIPIQHDEKGVSGETHHAAV